MTERDRQRTERVRSSRAYAKATSRAQRYVADGESLQSLVAAAVQKAESSSGPLAAIIGSVKAAFRLVRAYANGSYRDISWQSLVILVAAVVYFVMPIDLIPDFIAVFGLLDDAAILGWTLRTLNQDIERFLAWEQGAAVSRAEAPEQGRLKQG